MDCDVSQNEIAIVMNYVDLSKYNYLPMITKDTWGIVLRRDDPLAGKEFFSIADLQQLPLICSRQWVDQEFPQWFASKSDHVNIKATYNLPFNGSIMAKAGIGYAVRQGTVLCLMACHQTQNRPLSYRKKFFYFLCGISVPPTYMCM